MTRLPPGISHLIAVQAGRFVGVSHVTVGRRLEAKTLPSVNVFGVDMIPITPLRVWKRERMRAERRRLELEREDAEEQDPMKCPRCGAAYNNGDPSSHQCPDIEPPETFRADD